jgi:signal peptidase II
MQAARGASLSSGDQPAPSDPTPSEPTSSGHAAGSPRHRTSPRHLLLFAGIAAVGYGVDVASKAAAVRSLTDQPPVEVVGDLLSLYLTYNSGAAFSIGTGYTEVLSLIAILAATVVLWVARRLGSVGWAVALGFLLAGICGNLSDRLFREPGPLRGHVVDFFMLPNFPVFNVADICINIAAAAILIQALRGIRVDGSRHPEQ